ncbi:MAG TPA: GWxTD domain-containing protein [Gemmatimonadales bacterium]|nr:GWxTD domain-containing protein [Gemmatimonadales bacterium]
MVALLLAVAALQYPIDPAAARAESLLAAGDVRAALRAAEQVVAHHPRDARAQVLLGRVHFARRVIGRYPALDAFRTAARLAPGDPEPLYWQMKVGFYLGSDEGDVLARDAILRILALTPDYEDVWDRFQRLYRNPDIWRRAERALARHPDNVVAMERRAELAIALEQPVRADSLAAEVLRRRAPHVPAFVLRAEANFGAGRDSAGYAWYDSALVYADIDSTGALWDAVWMIASPDEIVAQDSTPPGERRRFFERFWSKREPNFLTPGNERIAEHFHRIGYARRYFRLLHPLNGYHRWPGYRAIIMQTQRDYLQRGAGQQPPPFQTEEPYPGSEYDRLLAAGRQLPDAGTATSSALGGLDARGLVYIRHGPPDQMLPGIFDPLDPIRQDDPLDVEGWLYRTPEGTLTIGFRRASGSTDPALAGGDFIFLPTNRRQARSTQVALRTDHTALPAPLEARAWSAYFKSRELGLSDAYYKAAADSAAAVLWDSQGGALRAAGAGLLELTVPPGRYAFGLDADSAGVLGRIRGEVIVPRFSLVDLGLSSLALAPAGEAGPLDRDAVLRGMPADLVYPARTPLAAYVEVYGLTTDRDGRSHYRVHYTFAPVRSALGRLLGGARPVEFEFDREALTSSITSERLVIEADRLPAGRYRVTLAVTDLRRNVKSESVALDITVR